MMLKAVIFDLDGTLLDTLDDLADSANEALAACGYPTHLLKAYRTFIGDGMAVLMERILPEAARNADAVAGLLGIYQAAYARRWKSKTAPYAGILPLLDTLAARGIPLAVLSNKPQAWTEICVAHFLGSDRFQLIFGQRETVPRKPHPAGALEIAAALQLDPAEIAFVGDTATDMDTATAAGMVPVGALWGFRPRSELEAHGARVIVEHPENIAALFEPATDPATS